jgi:hypothetical protein
MAAKTLIEFQSEFRLEYGTEPTPQDYWYAAIRSMEVAPSVSANTGNTPCPAFDFGSRGCALSKDRCCGSKPCSIVWHSVCA